MKSRWSVTDGKRTVGWTDGQTDGRTCQSSLCTRGSIRHSPVSASDGETVHAVCVCDWLPSESNRRKAIMTDVGIRRRNITRPVTPAQHHHQQLMHIRSLPWREHIASLNQRTFVLYYYYAVDWFARWQDG